MKSVKLFVFGFKEFLNVPISTSKLFRKSIKIVFLSDIRLFQYLGFIFFPVIFSGSTFLLLSVTISFLSNSERFFLFGVVTANQ